MYDKHTEKFWKNFLFRIIVISFIITFICATCVHFFEYYQFQVMTINNLKESAKTVHEYAEDAINPAIFYELNTIEDESKDIYHEAHISLNNIRRVANIRYLYTATINDNGEYIYVVDGLDPDPDPDDFRHVGDLIEEEIIPELEKSLNDEIVLSEDFHVTEWGIVYVAYFPVHDSNGNVIGAIGMEFECEPMYNSFVKLRKSTFVVVFILAAMFSLVSFFAFKKTINNAETIVKEKDHELIDATEEALRSSEAKSEFLSRMSHEIRTPMNSIVGMTSIAEKTDDMDTIRHCLDTVHTSSIQLLSLINNILDISKIESGKLELNYVDFYAGEMIVDSCKLLLDAISKKHQNLSIYSTPNIHPYFRGDKLRLSQIVTNLLANAVKFTPEYGSISISIKEVKSGEKYSIMRFSVTDTGIGISDEQISKIFSSFEQADGSISRKFGGTGLGLAISKSLVEKMNGKIWVESELGKGSSFIIELPLEHLPFPQNEDILVGNSPDNIKCIIIGTDEQAITALSEILNEAKVKFDISNDFTSASNLLSTAKDSNNPYNLIFMDYTLTLQSTESEKAVLEPYIDRNITILMAPFLNWNDIYALKDYRPQHLIPMPLFRSVITNEISAVLSYTAKISNGEDSVTANSNTPNLSDHTFLLAEDIEINREIFSTMLSDTGAKLDMVENGLEAVKKVEENPNKYDLIFMDIQMPEMDGYQATRKIRTLDIGNSKTVPIIAITANAFKEDIDHSLESGMNSHLAKPIDYDDLYAEIRKFIK